MKISIDVIPLWFPILEITAFDLIEAILYAAGTIFSVLLSVLSITAYRNTHLKKLLYAAFAFSLFAIFLLYDYMEVTLPIDNPFTDIVFPSVALVILVFFFLAVINKK